MAGLLVGRVEAVCVQYTGHGLWGRAAQGYFIRLGLKLIFQWRGKEL